MSALPLSAFGLPATSRARSLSTMPRLQIDIPDDLFRFLTEQAAKTRLADAGSYLLHLAQAEQAHQHLRNLALQGLASGPGAVVDDEYHEALTRFIDEASKQLGRDIASR